MKDYQLLYTWGTIFFATSLLAVSASASTIAWVMGLVCVLGGLFVKQAQQNEKID